MNGYAIVVRLPVSTPSVRAYTWGPECLRPSFATLRRLRVLNYRNSSIRQNSLKLLRAPALRRQPRLRVFGFQVDDTPVMPRRRHVRRRLIGNGREAADVRLLRVRPMRPQTSDQQRFRRFRCELQNDIFRLFPGLELSMLHGVQLHVLVEALHHHESMMMAELLSPELLQVVAPRVVQPRELLVVERRLPGRPAKIPHRRQDVV